MSATLIAGRAEYPVKIRDLSAEGAQVECSPVPVPGTAMTMVRGRLTVRARVSWSTDTRCGLHFLSRIRVRDWMATPVNREQRRVDQLIAIVRSGPIDVEQPARRGPAGAELAADDLARVSRLLATVSDALAADPAAVARHGVTLQSLDIAAQTLAVLAETLPADDPRQEARTARLAELRTACSAAMR